MKVNHYLLATSLEEAHQALLASPKNTIIGGGLWLKKSNANVDTLIDLSSLHLDEIIDSGDEIIIGAYASQRSVETHSAIVALADGMLSKALSEIMGVQFRNTATIGGSIMGKYPFSDVITPLLALNTKLVFYPNKTISLDDFLLEKGRNTSILTQIIVKKGNIHGYFYKAKYSSLDFPLLNVAITNTSGKYRIVLGARPFGSELSLSASEYLNEIVSPTIEDFKKAGQIVYNETRFMSNNQGSEEYRKEIAKVYVARGLEEVSK